MGLQGNINHAQHNIVGIFLNEIFGGFLYIHSYSCKDLEKNWNSILRHGSVLKIESKSGNSFAAATSHTKLYAKTVTAKELWKLCTT